MSTEHENGGQRFEWDDEKAVLNLAKHGVTFSEAASVFTDGLAILFADDAHSEGERRYFAIGRSDASRVLVVFYTERQSGAVIRIISAREARGNEGKEYVEHSV